MSLAQRVCCGVQSHVTARTVRAGVVLVIPDPDAALRDSTVTCAHGLHSIQRCTPEASSAHYTDSSATMSLLLIGASRDMCRKSPVPQGFTSSHHRTVLAAFHDVPHGANLPRSLELVKATTRVESGEQVGQPLCWRRERSTRVAGVRAMSRFTTRCLRVVQSHRHARDEVRELVQIEKIADIVRGAGGGGGGEVGIRTQHGKERQRTRR